MDEQQKRIAVSEPFWSWLDLAIVLAVALGAITITHVLLPGINAPEESLSWVLSRLGIYGLVCGVIVLILKVRYHGSLKTLLKGPWQKVGWLIGSGLALAIGTNVLNLALGGLPHSPWIELVMDKRVSCWVSLPLNALFLLGLRPLCEGAVFRGIAQPLFVRQIGQGWGILLVAVLSGLSYGQQYGISWKQIVLFILVSVIYGWVRHKYESTAASIIVHSAFNLLAFPGLVLRCILAHR